MGDTLNLVQGWSNDTAIYLSNGTDTVFEDPSVGVDLRVYALGSQVTAGDALDGGNGNDTLFLTADNWWSDISSVLNFENVVVENNGDAPIGIVTSDNTVAAGATLTVDATALVLGDYDSNAGTPDTTGFLVFNGAAETDGNFVVLGGDGNDVITTGAGADSVNAGAGNNTVTTNDGNDVITTGNGSNAVDAGAGNDVVTTGSGDDTILGGEGNDTISAGDGTNTITGDGGRDIMTGGSGVDTYVYQLASDSSGLSYDTITGFQAGEKVTPETIVDLIDLTALGNVVFLGNFVNATLADTALVAGSGDLQVVYVTGEQFLYADFNDNGVIDDGDVAIELAGVQTMYADNLAA
jgi:Ca2+-binding RTX toxin-like protein